MFAAVLKVEVVEFAVTTFPLDGDNTYCYIAGIFPQQNALSLVTSRSHDI